MQTSYFDQQRVAREKARRGRAAARPRRPWRVPAPFRKEPRGRRILHLDLSRRAPSFCLGFQGRGALFDPRAVRRWRPRGPLNPRRIPEGAGRAETGTSCPQSPRPRRGPPCPPLSPRARGRQRGGRAPAPRGAPLGSAGLVRDARGALPRRVSVPPWPLVLSRFRVFRSPSLPLSPSLLQVHNHSHFLYSVPSCACSGTFQEDDPHKWTL